MRELVARVKSVLHRSGRYSNEKEVLKFQTLTLRTPQKECFVDDEPITLTTTEFDLLAFFLKTPTQRSRVRKSSTECGAQMCAW